MDILSFGPISLGAGRAAVTTAAGRYSWKERATSAQIKSPPNPYWGLESRHSVSSMGLSAKEEPPTRRG